MELIKNAVIAARVDGYTAEGAGVCHAEGRAVFVPGTITGELWEIRIVKVSSSAVWGRGERLLEASGMRREPDCSAFPRCGGCTLRHMDYTEELSLKLRRVNDAIHRIGGLSLSISDIIPAEDDALRRQKVIFNVGEKDGHPVAGFYRARSHDIVPCPDCAAVPEEALRVRDTVLGWMEDEGIPAYDEAADRNGVRHIFIRRSRLTGKTVVTLTVSRSPKKAALEALCGRLRLRCPEIAGLVLNENPSRGNTVLDGDFRTLWGEAELIEELCGLTFSLSPRSFFQVNPPQAETLYEKALEYADIRPGTAALDLYCGTGTIGLCMASRGAQVIGAEVIPAAVENAKENAERNGLSEKCEFICADAGEAAVLLEKRNTRPEVIVVDPPRKGLGKAVIDAAVKMAPERIVYVSCDPGTLARDLALFNEQGYAPRSGIAVDMFPRTPHVETVVLLSQQRPNDKIRVELDLTELDITAAEKEATYQEIKDFILEKHGTKVSSLYIALVKEKMGIKERENYNLPRSADTKQPKCPPEKEKLIFEALRHFQMI